MANTSCKYMGLQLQSPLIAGSCGLTNSVEKMKKMEACGIGAVVLKSIFEEQITNEVMQSVGNTNFDVSYRDALDYIKGYTQMASYEKYTQLIREAKKELTVPVIASINCSSDGDWVSYAKRIEDAGADALELNIFFLPADFVRTRKENEELYFKIIEHVKENIKIPLAIKTGYYFSALAKMLQSLSYTGIDALVLFNRFFAPDIDIEKMQIKAASMFTEGEGFSNTLRWIAIMDEHVKCDLSATSGVRSSEDVIKLLLAGAESVQLATILYNKGIEYIETILDGLKSWMDRHNYATINDFKGKMNFNQIENPEAYLRIQFMKYFAGIE
jgi:dihydroorotate dehydrogenase (fumarate)